jgi:hypothetical protein
MALQGKYNFKGIEISEGYIKVDSVNYNASHIVETTEKTAAVYNEDGSLKTAAVVEKTWTEKSPANFSGKVYKDKAERDSNPNNWLTEIWGQFEMTKNTSAKNAVTQAYAALKATDDYKDYTDV